MQATDITAPVIEATLCGRRVALRFDHNQMRMAELYWQHTARTKLGYLGIVDQAIYGTYVGLGALCYGAAASQAMAENKTPIGMDAFDHLAQYGEMRAAQRAVLDAVMESMPKAGGGAKNAEGRRARTTPGQKCAEEPCAPASDTTHSGR